MPSLRKLNWLSPKITLSESVQCGRGQIAKEKIFKDEILVIFGGHVMTMAEFYELPPELQEFPYQISEEPDLLFGPASLDELSNGEYFNHSCDPNTGFTSEIHLVAMRDIPQGEELTFDYAMCTTADFGDMACNCGAALCRGFIKGSDWRLSAIQLKYKGYFMPYIAAKIAQLNVQSKPS